MHPIRLSGRVKVLNSLENLHFFCLFCISNYFQSIDFSVYIYMNSNTHEDQERKVVLSSFWRQNVFISKTNPRFSSFKTFICRILKNFDPFWQCIDFLEILNTRLFPMTV